jgi:spermidine synthase
MYAQRLAPVTTLNSDTRPVAYLYNLMLWAEMQRSGVLQSLVDHGRSAAFSAAAIVVIAGIAAGLRRRGVSYSVFTAGLISMASSVVVLLAYQSAFGYVYERVGLLTAAFMAGSAAGAYAARDRVRPLALLRAVEAAGAALLLLAPLFFRAEAFYVALMALLGASGGAVYVAAVSCGGAEDADGQAGGLYALDLAGAFVGALLCAVVLVPLFGILNTLLGMVVLKMLSLSILVLAGNEQS